jgi:hypothetical protein
MKRLIFLSILSIFAMVAMVSPAGIANANSSSLTSVSAPDVQYSFIVVNSTGHGITKLYMAPHSSEDWDSSDELLQGQSFGSGSAVKVTFNAKQNSDSWDLMVAWADGDDNSKWENIDLNGASKLTLKYNRETNTASIARE